MEDRELWRFTPAVTHGDLHEDSLLIEGERVVAVTGWTDLHSGDPADDFAWLTAAGDAEFTEKVLAAYRHHRSGEVDEHLMRRAALTAEFALAQWLVRGHASENPEMIAEAKGLLEQLKADIETYGGQPIALTPVAGDEPAPATEAQDSRPVVRAGAEATVSDTGEWAESGEDDDEPAVITDAAAAGISQHQDVTDESQATGAVAYTPRPLPDDEPTGSIPVVQDHSFAEEPLPDAIFEDDDEDDLPIHPDEVSERRSKEKHFFPATGSASSAISTASAPSAQSARSAESAQSADSAQPESSAESAPSVQRESSAQHDVEVYSAAPAATDSPQSAGPPPSEETDERGDGSIYHRHPGLRPPTG